MYIDDETFQIDAGSDSSAFNLPPAPDCSEGICTLLGNDSVFDSDEIRKLDLCAEVRGDGFLFDDSQLAQLDKGLVNGLSASVDITRSNDSNLSHRSEVNNSDSNNQNIESEVSFSIQNMDDVNFDEGMLAALQGTPRRLSV